MKNQLSSSQSLYLQQHADDPVHWQKWSMENLALAKSQNKLILLSIGYSSCHWCHVMAHESFQDKEVAEYMNENYFCIKIDREEYPDVDSYYMQVCTAMTGQGGWPLNVILAPDRTPLVAGTYFPPRPMGNRPSWLQFLMSVNRSWDENPEKLRSQGNQILKFIEEQKDLSLSPSGSEWDEKKILESLKKEIDPRNGGFFSAPKFPFLYSLELLYDLSKKYQDSQGIELFQLSLSKMLLGGIYDQVSGGMMRYSTDSQWLVPHFEKMLYTNGPLLGLLSKLEKDLPARDLYDYYLDKTWQFLQNHMLSHGALYGSSIDADSPEGEGYYYSYTFEEAKGILQNEMALNEFGVSEMGNFEGRNILHFQNLDNLESKKSCLNQFAEIQHKREMPKFDPKVIFSWNGLLALNLAKAYVFSEDVYYYKEYGKIYEALQENITVLDSHIDVKRIVYANGETIDGRGEDYAYAALIYLYAYRFYQDSAHIKKAERILQYLERNFKDGELFRNGPIEDAEVDIQKVEVTDDTIPSVNALVYEAYKILALYKKDLNYQSKADRMHSILQDDFMKNPVFYSYFIHMVCESQDWRILETNASWDEIYFTLPMNLWLEKESREKNNFKAQICTVDSCQQNFDRIEELQDYLEQYNR